MEKENEEKVSCTECRYLILCNLDKQAFYKITGTPCEEFQRKEKDNGRGQMDKADYGHV